MNKRLYLCFALLFLLSLSSCQLAREDGMNIHNNDRLVGVFITQEHIDLFDFDSWMEDNIHTIGQGGEITVSDSEQYSGRIYAELKSIIHIDEETGEEFETWEYQFEDLDGIPFFISDIKHPDGEIYTTTSSDGKISDSHLSIGNDTSLDGTIYVTPNARDMIPAYINPVYQSSNGQVYLTSGDGMSLSGDMSEGAVYTITLDEKHMVTENGETTEESFKVTVNFAIKYPPTKVTIVQMGSENIPISQKEYSPAALPEKMEINPEAEYVIVETQSSSLDGDMINREILSKEEEYFTSYITGNNGICEGKAVSLVWQ